MPTSERLVAAALALGLAPLLIGCATDGAEGSRQSQPAPSSPAASTPAASTPATAPVEPPGTPAATSAPESTDAGPQPSDDRPRQAALSIPRLAIRDLVVVPYRGWTDDAPGTRIQDRGRAASPHGPRGGVGPGGVGNYQVTAHRLSSTKAFLHLPRLQPGDVVHVRAGGVRYTYRITATRRTSFRSPASLRAQRAPVPGRPGVPPTRAMITLSTCATPEDHAAGNFWSDRFGNPEHRIDKVGVLVRTRAA